MGLEIRTPESLTAFLLAVTQENSDPPLVGPIPGAPLASLGMVISGKQWISDTREMFGFGTGFKILKRDIEHLNSFKKFYFLGCRQQQLIAGEMAREVSGKPRERQRFRNLPFAKRIIQQRAASD